MNKILFSIIFLFLSGCTSPILEIRKEPLTGQEYCFYECKLISIKADQEGELILKYFRTDNTKVKPRIKAILKIRQNERREYDIDPNEMLILLIDGVTYPIDLLNSTKIAAEEVHYNNNVYVPGGRSFSLGSVQEVTRRRLAFFLPEDILLKILKANDIYFKVISSSTKNSPTNAKEAIILKFDPKNLISLQELKSRCIVN